MRHAKSDWNHPELEDIDRPLNHRGQKDAPEMGKRIHKFKFTPDLMIASISKRTRETAQLVAHELRYKDAEIQFASELYEASIEDIVHIIRSTDDHIDRLMLIGHNPSFTGIVGYLGDRFLENLPTSGIALLEFNTPTWQTISNKSGKCVWLDTPKNHD